MDRRNMVEGNAPNEPDSIDLEEQLALGKVVGQMVSTLQRERQTVELCDSYLYGEHPAPYMPREATREYKALADRAVTNVVPLVINNIAQLLYVEGYLPKDASEDGVSWIAWQYNRMDQRQSALFRAALRYGVSYAVVSQGDTYPVIRGVSPRKMIALYEDPANDEWPAYALELIDRGRETSRYRVWDESNVYTVERSHTGEQLEVLSLESHGFWTCPVVRFTYNLDLEGRYQGEITPIITAQDRLNQTIMDRLLVQTFGSWKIRTISGMALASDDETARAEKIQISKDRFLVASDPDTKFGSIAETSLAPFISASQSDSEALAALAAVPPHYLTGTLNNLGAEAIAEARASLEAKATEIKHAFGECVEQMMRAISWYMGDVVGADDYQAQVVWRDAQNRSLAQVADALGKISTMLGVPQEALWDRLPGVTKADVERWKQLREDENLITALDQVGNAVESSQKDEELSDVDADTDNA